MKMGRLGLSKADRIKVEVFGASVIVTMAGTAYRAVFHKHPDEPRLIEAEGVAVDKAAPMEHEEFEKLAWEAAVAKARELGWIA